MWAWSKHLICSHNPSSLAVATKCFRFRTYLVTLPFWNRLGSHQPMPHRDEVNPLQEAPWQATISSQSCCQEPMNGAHCPTHAPPRAPEQQSPKQIQPTCLGDEAEGSQRPSVQGYCFWAQAFTVNPALVFFSLLAFNPGLTLIRIEQGSCMVCLRSPCFTPQKLFLRTVSGCNSSFSSTSRSGLLPHDRKRARYCLPPVGKGSHCVSSTLE